MFFLAFYFSDLLILLTHLPASDETRFLLAGSVLDCNFSSDFSTRGLLVISFAMFNSLLIVV